MVLNRPALYTSKGKYEEKITLFVCKFWETANFSDIKEEHFLDNGDYYEDYCDSHFLFNVL